MMQNNGQQRALPDGWRWASLSEVTTINRRDPRLRELPDDLPVTFAPMAAVDAERGAITKPEVRPLKDVKKGFTSFSDGDVIFAKITPCMENGKAAITRNLENGVGFGSTEFHVLSPGEDVLPEWVFYFVRQETFRKAAKACFAGTAGQLRVPASFLVDYQIPIPPKSDQIQIVSRIEELFSQLDAGVTALRSVQVALKRYKASVLKAACEGRLAPQEPGDEPAEALLLRLGKAPLEGQGLPALPVGWCWARMGDLFTVSIGGTPSRNKPEYWDGDINWVSSGQVTNNHIKDTREKITIGGFEKSNAKLYPPGTVLLAMIGEGKTRGQVAVLDVTATTNQNVAGILVSATPILPDWVFYWFISRYEQTRRSGSGGMQYALNAGRIRNFSFPVPPLNEQRQIITEIERRISVTYSIEASIIAELARAGRLRQAVLRAAFEGRLV